MTKTEEHRLIEQAKESIEQYRKLQLFIEHGLHEMLWIRDVIQNVQNNNHIKNKMKQRAITQKAEIDQYTKICEKILATINKIENRAFQTVLKGIYIDNEKPVELAESMDLTLKEVHKIKEQALIEYIRGLEYAE